MPPPKRIRNRKPRAREETAPPAPLSPVEVAIRYLGGRRRFEREVRAHLKKRGVDERDVRDALVRLRELSLVADEETTRAWIRDRMNFAPRGRGLMRRELLGKGVSADVVDSALEELLDEPGEQAAALEFLRKGQGRWSGLPEATARRRMWSALARRGFPMSVCRAALVRFAEETGLDAEDGAWD